MKSKSSMIWSIVFVIAISVGCGESVDPKILAARGKVLLSAAPEGSQSITEAKELAQSQSESSTSETLPSEVTLVGRIEAGDFDPFDKEIAAFMLSELPAGNHDHGEGQDVDNCPFCKRRAANAPKAHVVLVDENTNPISIPVPSLLDVKKGDQVIVQGNAQWNDELNVLEVKSSGIYILP